MNDAQKSKTIPPDTVYRLFRTGDDALHFHLNFDPADEEPMSLSVHNTEDGEEIVLAIDVNGIAEVIGLLAEIRLIARKIEAGETIVNDVPQEYKDPGDEEEVDEEEEENDGEDAEET